MGNARVSILIVARNSESFIGAALSSARSQTLTDIEIVVVDDGSSDGTAAIVRDHGREDMRVRLIDGPQAGLGAVRNASIDACRTRFAIILDSDDLLHPRHVEWLLASRLAHGDEICAANMIEFEAGGRELHAGLFANGQKWNRGRRVEIDEFAACGMFGSRLVSLGYLKPLFDMTFLRRNDLRYDERLRIGEDFDLVLRAMLAGARYRYLPRASYYYRRHSQSTSHRLSRADLEGLLAALDGIEGQGKARSVPGVLAARRANISGAMRHLEAIAAIKAGQWPRALRMAASDATACRLTLSSLREAGIKRLGFNPARPSGRSWPGREERLSAIRSIEAALDGSARGGSPLSVPDSNGAVSCRSPREA